MIVKPITDIKYFTDKFGKTDPEYEYRCDYHPEAPQKDFKTHPTFIADLYNCKVHPLPFLITEDQNMVADFVWPLLWKYKHKPDKSHGLWSKWGDKIDLKMPTVTRRFSEHNKYVWLPIDQPSANNAWHVWIDMISKFRLISMSDVGHRSPENYVYVVPNHSEYFQSVVNQVMPEISFLTMQENDVWEFTHLIVPSMSNREDGILNPIMPQWLSARFNNMYPGRSNANRKLFITREDAPARRLHNADELLMALDGWEMINLSQISIKEQMQIFSEAKVILSTHGAGLISMLWSKDATIIEITQKDMLHKKVYPILSSCLGHKHHVLLAEKIPLRGDKPTGVKRKKDYNNLKINVTEVLKIVNN